MFVYLHRVSAEQDDMSDGWNSDQGVRGWGREVPPLTSEGGKPVSESVAVEGGPSCFLMKYS